MAWAKCVGFIASDSPEGYGSFAEMATKWKIDFETVERIVNTCAIICFVEDVKYKYPMLIR